MKISIEIHFNRSKIFLLCFYDAYDVNLRKKKVNKYPCRISSFYRSSHRRRSARKVFLIFRFSQYSEENTCFESLCRSSSLQFFQKLFSCEYCENFQSTYFEEDLPTTASYFMKKSRQSWRLNNSSQKFWNQWKSMGFQFCKLTCSRRKIQRKCMQI